MANTVIQLKFSTITDKPTSLNIAEPGYSYSSNIFYIGSPDSTGSIAIGGKFYLDQQQIIFDTANAAFASANNSTKANSAFDQANAAFEVANSAAIAANTPSHVANSAAIYANGAFTAANTADSKAVSAGSYANSAFVHANSSFVHANAAFNHANSGFNQANTAQDTAAAAFIRANNSIDANSGGTISGDLTITGNLIVTGEEIIQNVSTIAVEDSLFELATNNAGDGLDIGFFGQYVSGGTKYTAVYRDHDDGKFRILVDGTEKPTAGNTVNAQSFSLATVVTNVEANTVIINGQNIETYTTNAYNHANAGFDQANTAQATGTAAGSYANSAFLVANSASVSATAAFNHANAGFNAANTADSKAVSAGSYANSAFNHANAAFNTANTDVTNISITGANYGTASAVPAFRVEANGRISSANSTAIAIDASAITSGTLGVTRGGTGAGTFTNNGVLLGQGTGAFTTASSSTEGHVLTINNSGVPTFAHLQGGTF